MYVYMFGALGRAGDYEGMANVLDQLKEDQHVDISLMHITSLIYQYGCAQNQTKVDEIYDLMLALDMEATEKLNEVLIHVCKVDALSVVWNAPNSK